MSNKKSDEQILFPKEEVAGIIVEPWSFGKLFDISDSLETVIDKVEEKNLDEALIKEDVNILDIARLFTIARKEVLRIIAITVDRPEEDIRSLSMEDGVKLSFIIFTQNKDTIKNAFGPLLHLIQERGKEGAETKQK